MQCLPSPFSDRLNRYRRFSLTALSFVCSTLAAPCRSTVKNGETVAAYFLTHATADTARHAADTA